MLTRDDNELLTNIDRGSPMGEVFRRFWIPALLADELAGPDCDPVEMTLWANPSSHSATPTAPPR